MDWRLDVIAINLELGLRGYFISSCGFGIRDSDIHCAKKCLFDALFRKWGAQLVAFGIPASTRVHGTH